MRILKFFFPVVVVTAGLLVNVTVSSAKPDYTKKEKKSCTYCHTSATSKELNDAGKYYAAHDHSLEGYQAKK
ncbi:MAG: hypothetical protein LAO79_13100 [Acidobacteriia bacterium]|nr:hypothetical protein [Terriglobia bacterium]